MPVYAVDVIIPIEIYADNAEEALQLAKIKVIEDKKDLAVSMLEARNPQEISFF